MKKFRLICPTPTSVFIADKLLLSGLDFEKWERPNSIRQGLLTALNRGQSVVAVCALGIIVRVLSDAKLPAKTAQTPIICITENGKFAIPVLGGHNGANRLAQIVAASTDGQAIVTTASDQSFDIALDDPPDGWAMVADPRQFSNFMQALLEEGRANLNEAPQWVKDSSIPHNEAAKLKISVDERSTDNNLTFVQTSRLAVGIGCERGCSASDIYALLVEAEQALKLSLDDAIFGSIDIKQDEGALVEIAPEMRFFTAEELAQKKVPNPSDIVLKEVGTPSVAEASALALAGKDATLILPKIKNQRATLAVAKSKSPMSSDFPGRGRSHLSIVGLGPGSEDLCSEQAWSALIQSTKWVGYSLYLDQAEQFAGEARQRLDFKLGDEEARCRAALDAASKGKRVALICSGDPQVYAMAQVVYELLARHPERSEWQQTFVETLPGITAMSALAAKVGAPLGHDFCAISLSDLNTPWEVIEKKVKAAAESDFVIGFYNPKSRTRNWQLPRAIEILARNRPDDCPVAFGRNVARADENITLTTLSDLNPDDIDMFTCVIVGASFTQRHKNFMFTPRGYKLS
ncbi:MAG: precorrin-3B C(17)-methyltransferase [Alphaproteobacteria bacterium]